VRRRKVPAMSAPIETRCSFVYTASPGRPLRYAEVQGQAATEEGAQRAGVRKLQKVVNELLLCSNRQYVVSATSMLRCY
jgi:hypothetical protein